VFLSVSSTTTGVLVPLSPNFRAIAWWPAPTKRPRSCWEDFHEISTTRSRRRSGWAHESSPSSNYEFGHELLHSRLAGKRLVGAAVSQQGRQDSNLQPPVLETGALPIELRP
jgi:hypothetical protein